MRPALRSRRFVTEGASGDLVFVLARARALALSRGVAFVRGPEGETVSLAYVNDRWDVRAASFFSPAWLDQARLILSTYGTKEDPFA